MPIDDSPNCWPDESGGLSNPALAGSFGPGDLGLYVPIRALNHTTPAQRAIVADCLGEVARAILETVPPKAGCQLDD
jgi:hypothetical protein